jgi:hypothetical protein
MKSAMKNELQRYWPTGHTKLVVTAAFHSDSRVASEAWRAWQESCDFDRSWWSDLRMASLAHRRLGQLIDTGDLEPRILGVRRYVWSTGQLRVAAGLKLLRRLADADVKFVLLKGAVFLARHPKAVIDRFVSDLDVLIDRTDWEKAVGIGFQDDWMPEQRLSRGFATHRMHQTHHSLSLVKGSNGAVDLHQFSLLLNRQSGSDRGLWERAMPGSLSGIKVLLPDPSDHLAVIFGHAFLFTPFRSFDWVGDALATIATPGFDWDLFSRIVLQRELAVPAAAALTYVSEGLGHPIPANTMRRIVRYVREPFVTELAAAHRAYLAKAKKERIATYQAECIRCLRALPRAGSKAQATADRTTKSGAQGVKRGENAILPLPTSIGPGDRVRIRLSLQILHLPQKRKVEIVLRSPDNIPLEIARWVIWSNEPRTVELKIDGALIDGRAMEELVLRMISGPNDARMSVKFDSRKVRNYWPNSLRRLVWTNPALSKLRLAAANVRRRAAALG